MNFLISRFGENMNENEKAFPPSKYIKDALAEKGWTQTDLAAILGRYPAEISSFLAKEKITVEFAKELSVVFGNTPEYWLNLENKFRLSLIPEVDETIKKRSELLSAYPLKEMQKRGWISNAEQIETLEPELRRFFEMDANDSDFESKVSFKRTIKEANLNGAERAWLYRAKHLAKALPVAEYDEANLDKLISQIRKYAAKSKAVIRIPELFSTYGIRFVIVEQLPKARIDGAAFWLDENSPVIAMSVRFDNIGSFYFALLHETMHIKYRDNFSFDDLESSATDDTEIRANEEAADILIPQKRLETFIQMYSPYYSEARINNLATQLKIHPGIIIGQLQHKKEIGYNAHQKIMAKVRELVTTTAFTDGWGHPVPRIKSQGV
jgi:HTH-type transcriptional regulator/antitoxin HigA